MEPDIPMEEVESSNVQSVGYHGPSLTLVVRFKNGGTYRYLGVLPEHYQALREAESIGKHLHSHFRGKYETVKVLEPEPTP